MTATAATAASRSAPAAPWWTPAVLPPLGVRHSSEPLCTCWVHAPGVRLYCPRHDLVTART